MHTVQALSRLVEHQHLLAYLLIFVVTIFEGEVIAISAGIMILLGALNFWFCLLALLAGGFLKTLFGYSLGRLLHNKFNSNRFFRYIEKKVLSAMPHFEAKPFWSIFISKFMMMNHVVIVFAGYKKIQFKKYLQAEITSTIIWAFSMLALGYFFSYTAIRVSKKLSEFALIVVLFIVAFFLLEKVVSLLYDFFENFLNNNGEKK